MICVVFDYLLYFYKILEGDWLNVIVVYNLGEGCLLWVIKKNCKKYLLIDFWFLDLLKEMILYVFKLLVLFDLVKCSDEFGVKW